MLVQLISCRDRIAMVERQLEALADKYAIPREQLTELADGAMTPRDLDEFDRLLNVYADVLDELQELEANAA